MKISDFVLFCFVPVILWHFTAVACSVCKNIEDENEEETEFRRTGERRGVYEEC